MRDFLQTKQADLNMKFEDFVGLYYADMKTRLREHTMRTKRYIIDLKIVPYFKDNKKMNDIKPKDIRKWQNELIQQGYSQTYLKTIHNQINAIFNFAVRYYELKSNLTASQAAWEKIMLMKCSFGQNRICEIH